MESEVSFQNSPFPVAMLTAAGEVVRANASWSGVSAPGPVWDALRLAEHDAEAFVAKLSSVFQGATTSWLDVEANVLAERRWSRCHFWLTDNPSHIAVAVIPIREPLGSDRSFAEVDRIERVLDHTADAIAIVDVDLTVRYASGFATRFLGASGAANEGRSALSFVHPDDVENVAEAFAACFENPHLAIKVRFRALHDSGEVVWVDGIGTNLFDDPTIRGILISLNDITEIIEARSVAEASQVALESEKERYQTLARFTPTGVFEFTPEGMFTFVNERFQQITGLKADEEFSWDLVDERDHGVLRNAWTLTDRRDTVQATVRINTSAGEMKWVTIRAAEQSDGRFLSAIEDHTAEITKQNELAHRAGHDDLTGLPNREQLLTLLAEVATQSSSTAVLFVDLDNFKDINDGLGHQVGDRVLIEVADRIVDAVRPGDIVGRLHGDEFLVLCRQDLDDETAADIAARIVEAILQPISLGERRLVVSASVGIALSGGETSTPADVLADRILADADLSMYEAKRRGGSRSVAFIPELRKRAGDRLRLHGEFQQAFETDQLELHYQPIVDLRSGATVRSEALVRWHHPVHGFILPDRFIPDIEDSDLIDRLGMWVVERVASELAASGPLALPVNVNVSPRQLTGTFADSILGILDRHAVPGDRLMIEITERVLMDDLGPVAEQLEKLQSRGIGIAVDDFGAGYSSLTYLRRFPFDHLKIDGAFIDTLDTNRSDRVIVGALIELAASLGGVAVAEKVERQAQVDALVDLGCDLAQGYLLGRPEPGSLPTRS